MVVALPSSEHVALAAVLVLAAIVIWDAYWLTSNGLMSPNWAHFLPEDLRGKAKGSRDGSTVGQPWLHGGDDGLALGVA